MNVLHREIMYASCVAPHIIERVSTDKGAITLCLIALTTPSYLFFGLRSNISFIHLVTHRFASRLGPGSGIGVGVA